MLRPVRARATIWSLKSAGYGVLVLGMMTLSSQDQKVSIKPGELQLAIAHDLEHLYVEPEPKAAKTRGRKKAGGA